MSFSGELEARHISSISAQEWQPGDDGVAEPQPVSSQRPSDILVCIDRLQSLCPKAFKEAKEGMGDNEFWPAVLDKIEHQGTILASTDCVLEGRMVP